METNLHIGDQLVVYCHNIEGISKAKCQLSAKLAYDHGVHVICLQETHTKSEEDILSRGIIEGFNLIAALHSPVHGIAIYLLNTIEEYDIIFNDIIEGVFLCAVNINGITVTNIYKPPSVSWSPNVLPLFEDPCLYTGDMNSHHTLWGYRTNDFNGENLLDWMNNNEFELVFNPKDKKSFFSKVHKSETNPDLCFVSSSLFKNSKTKRKVLNDFPHSQHRPIIIDVGLTINLVQSTPKPRWNFMKANWLNYSVTKWNMLSKKFLLTSRTTIASLN